MVRWNTLFYAPGAHKINGERIELANRHPPTRPHHSHGTPLLACPSSIPALVQHIGRLVCFTERMFEQLGGVNGAVTEWIAAVEHAKAEGKWHLVLRSHKALLELVKVCDQVKPKVEDMGPEELDKALRANLIELICNEPVLALLAAEQLEGWTVIPPPEIGADWDEALASGRFTEE